MNLFIFLPFLYYFFHLFIAYLLMNLCQKKKEGGGGNHPDLWLKDDGRLSSGWPRCCRRANIQHARGPHRPLRGPSWNHDMIFKFPTRGGTSRHLIRAVRPAFPAVFCALLLRLRPGRKDQHGSAEEKATARLKL